MDSLSHGLINPAKVGMPNHLDYNAMKKQGLSASARSSYFRSDYTGNFNQNSIANITVPCTQNQVLDASSLSLAFTLTVNASANDSTGVWLDGGAHCIIQRLTTYWNSLMIDQLVNYNLLQNILLDTTMNTVERINYGSIMWGNSDWVNNETAGSARLGQKLTPGTAYTFCFPLLNILATSDKYIPLYAMAGSSLRFEILFEQLASAFRTSNGSGDVATINSYSVSNLELRGVVIELSDLALSMVKSATGGIYSLQTIRHDYFTDVVSAGGQYNSNINCKVSSLRNIRFVQRYSNAITDPYSNSLTAFILGGTTTAGGLSSFQFRYGSEYYPRRLVAMGSGGGWSSNDYIMPFWELMRSYQALNSLQPQIGFSQNNYVTQACIADTLGTAGQAGSAGTVPTSTYLSCFIGGVSFESFGGDRNTTCVQGLSTVSGLISYVAQYGAIGGPLTLSWFCEYDSQIDIQDGVVTISL